MPVSQKKLINYLNKLLQPERFNDYCPNGLQVAGRDQINTIITGVSACQALLDEAVEREADAVLVHHGYFWKGESLCLAGVQRERLATILKNDLNLIAYHLPLDAHTEFGNNALFARVLDFQIETSNDINALALGCVGKLPQIMSGDQLRDYIGERLSREPLYVAGSRKVERVAWCTGAAQDFILAAVNAGVDAYITGEASERTVHIARETGIHFYAAGHHATERYGVEALGEHLAEIFDINCQFVDIDNPV